MSTRFFVSLGTLVLLLAGIVFLVSQEGFEVKSAEELKEVADPLADMRYDGNRAENLRRLGAPNRLREATLQAANRIERQVGDKIALRLQRSERNEQLALDLCGRGELPRRYMLLENLVSEQNGERVVMSVSQVQFRAQEWFTFSLVGELHQAFERIEGGPDDAPARILAAVLAGKETDTLNSQGSWSNNDWDWEHLFEREPGLERKLTDFLASGMVTLERAQSALCGAE